MHCHIHIHIILYKTKIEILLKKKKIIREKENVSSVKLVGHILHRSWKAKEKRMPVYTYQISVIVCSTDIPPCCKNITKGVYKKKTGTCHDGKYKKNWWKMIGRNFFNNNFGRRFFSSFIFIFRHLASWRWRRRRSFGIRFSHGAKSFFLSLFFIQVCVERILYRNKK